MLKKIVVVKGSDVTALHIYGKRHGLFDLGLRISILLFFLLTVHARNDGVCLSQVCNETATLFLNHMNPDEDPCNNFYEYACGNFIKYANIQSGYKRIDQYLILYYEIEKNLTRILNTTITKKDNKPLRLSKEFYRACMSSTDNKNRKKIRNKITQNINSSGGWPIMDGKNGFKWNETNFDWQNMVRKLQELGYLSYVFFRIGTSKENDIEITIDTDELYDAKLIYIYFFGVPKTVVDEQVLEVARFKELLDTIRDSEYCNKNDRQTMIIHDLQEKIPEINWLEYIKAAGYFSVHENQTIFVNQLDFVSFVAQTLLRQPKRIIANYILSKFVKFVHDFFYREGVKRTTGSLSWKACMAELMIEFPSAISVVYIQEHFTREIQPTNDVRDILSHLKERYVKIFQKSSWMDDEMKTHALSKLAALWPHLAYPKKLLNNRKIKEYFKPLEISENTYFEILARIKKFESDKSIKNRGKYKRNWTLFSNLVEINPFNDGGKSISIPASIMHGIFFNKDRPKYVNYGAIGQTIAHEIGHTFDPGRFFLNQYRKFINLRSERIYRQRAKCITNMYDNYTVKQLNYTVNGRKTLDENFSDIVGLKAAYYAYKDWVDEHGEELILRGIVKSDTPKRLFWLSAANKFCAKYDTSKITDVTDIIGNFHSPEEARINVPLKNMPEFAADYDCPVGSKMNPIDRCPLF